MYEVDTNIFGINCYKQLLAAGRETGFTLEPVASICLEYWGDPSLPRTIGRRATAHGRRPCWGWIREGIAPSRNEGLGVMTPATPTADHTDTLGKLSTSSTAADSTV
jgi:hypothetical protein